jgi:cobalt/nickel transport system ATP-binding protein
MLQEPFVYGTSRPTVLEDVAFGPLNLGKSPKEARIMAMQTPERLNLSGF